MDQGLEERTNQFNNACQALVGIAHFDDRLSPVGAARGFVDRLPEPRGQYEAMLHRGRLLEMALMWAEAAHRRAHRDIGTLANPCDFSAAERTHRLWKTSDESPKAQFAGWAEGFFPALERDHAPRLAVRAARRLGKDFAAPLNVPQLARQCGAHVAVRSRMTSA
jgi:hypothetical protein